MTSFVGETIRYRREKRHLTQSQLAKKIKIATKWIAIIEEGGHVYLNKFFVTRLEEVLSMNKTMKDKFERLIKKYNEKSRSNFPKIER